MKTSEQPSLVTTFFPPITIEEDGGYWEGEVEIGGAKRALRVYVDAELAQGALLASASRLLEALPGLHDAAQRKIDSEAQAGNKVVNDYLTFHKEELHDDLPEAAANCDVLSDMTSALRIVGVGLWPDDTDGFRLVLDFSFGPTVSDELLVVYFTPTGEVTRVSHES